MNRAAIFGFLFGAIVMLSGVGRAATAYDALRAIQATRGEAVMNQLMVMRGESGTPQPQTWTVLMNDPEARSGIREFVIAGTEIRSERTPLRRFGTDQVTPVLDFSKLNLDSDGAFKIAESQATRLKVGFHSVDYVLESDTASGGPAWGLRLFDHMGAPVGNLRISAVDGKVLQALQLDSDARVIRENASPSPARKSPSTSATPAPEPDSRKPLGGVLGAISRTAGTVVEKTKDTSVRVVGTVEEVLTGERTIGRDDPSATPTPAP